MASTPSRSSRSRRRGRSKGPARLGKPNGKLNDRVEKVGPRHFGIAAVDSGKGQSEWLLCDFYGNLLIPPTEVLHQRQTLAVAIEQLREAMQDHRLHDVVVAVERAGRYQDPIRRAFMKAGFEVRIVHPFATKCYRQADSPDVKTDPIDLAAIVRATTHGFGLLEPPVDRLMRELQFTARHRRDLVHKTTMLRNQIHDEIDQVMPGYTGLFQDVFASPMALPVARHYGSADRLGQTDVQNLITFLRRQKIRCQRRTAERVLAWTKLASSASPDADLHRWRWQALHDDWLEKRDQIARVEQQMVKLLVQTPYVLMLAMPGVNVVSICDTAGEMGPIEHYANANCITGRAGIFPSRYQSSQTDEQGGLARRGNRRLRGALMRMAQNLRRTNDYFRSKAMVWEMSGHSAGQSKVRIAHRLSRILFHVVCGRRAFNHPGAREKHYVIDKLVDYMLDHEMSSDEILTAVQHAREQLPDSVLPEEADAIEQRRPGAARGCAGAKPLRLILPKVLANLRGTVQSEDQRD